MRRIIRARVQQLERFQRFVFVVRVLRPVGRWGYIGSSTRARREVLKVVIERTIFLHHEHEMFNGQLVTDQRIGPKCFLWEITGTKGAACLRDGMGDNRNLAFDERHSFMLRVKLLWLCTMAALTETSNG